jgi:hypothetical protein
MLKGLKALNRTLLLYVPSSIMRKDRALMGL